MPTPEQVEILAGALWQVLDDMGKEGTSCCVASKAYARVALEPFFPDETWTDWMSLDEAKNLIEDIERS